MSGPSSQRRTKPNSDLKGKEKADEIIKNKKLPPKKPMRPPPKAKPKEIK